MGGANEIKRVEINNLINLNFSGTHMEEFDDMDDEMEEENIDDDDDDDKVGTFLG